MHLLIGLGNPGKKYALNRHNIGFMAMDTLAGAYEFPSEKQKFSGLLTEGIIGDAKTLLFKPQKYMNLSGESVGELTRFHKIPLSHVIVFHDELDLPLGKIRVKRGGGAGGHNGLKSLDQHIGADYLRVRIGIGHPGNKDMVSDYVLSNFDKHEIESAIQILSSITIHMPVLLKGDEAGFMNKVTWELQQNTEE